MTSHAAQRTFTALAMPRAGHPEGHAVLLVETCGRSRREHVFTAAEAEQVRSQLDGALRAFFVGEEIVAGADTPRACTAPYPFRDHKTLAEGVGG